MKYSLVTATAIFLAIFGEQLAVAGGGHSSGVIMVRVSSFLNPGGKDAAGACCKRWT